MALLLSLVLLATPPPPAAPSQDSLLIDVAGRIVVLRAADFAPLPRDSVRASFHGGPALTYSGVRLTDVLRRVGVPIDSVHSPQLVQRLLVEAADGYRVVFSLAELAPGLGDRRVIVADRVDGQPLPATEGPWRLLVPDDGEHARWVRQVTALRVLDEPTPGGRRQ
jgi:DMSO/TMAO reductase YedYZ molybdopterin-dependent catalytic subunit